MLLTRTAQAGGAEAGADRIGVQGENGGDAVHRAKRRLAELENLVWHDDMPPHVLYHVGGLIARIQPEAFDPACLDRARRLSETHESLYQLLDFADDHGHKDHGTGAVVPALRAAVIDMLAWIDMEIASAVR
jgi:hypothetical protein